MHDFNNVAVVKAVCNKFTAEFNENLKFDSCKLC